MTADPSRCPARAPAWFVVTDQGVRLAGPYDTREEALAARVRVVDALRASMVQERFTGADIAARAAGTKSVPANSPEQNGEARDKAAVVVAFGRLVGPWQRLVPDV